jgi:universal stress protein A
MAIINRVLVPIDFSEGSRQALRLASEVAAAAGATLEVVHVVETPYLTSGGLELAPAADLTAWAEAEARAFVARHVPASPDGARAEVVVHLVAGAPATEILRLLEAHPTIDLLVMATHGRGGVSRLLLGSVSDKVVRTARCPVLTIREPEKR